MSSFEAGPTCGLNEQDYERLAARWITRELAEQAGIRRVTDNEGRFMFGRRADSEGILIPNWNPWDSSHTREYRLRLDNPPRMPQADGSFKDGQKYVQARESGNHAYIPRGAMFRVSADAPIIISEGEFKTIALWRLANHEVETPRFLPIGFAGVWNWRDRHEKTTDARGRRCDVHQPILDVRKFDFKGRKVILAFDADWESNSSVRSALFALTSYLTQERGAEVGHLRWDISEGKGIDDRLANVGPEPVLKDIAAVEFGGWQTRLIRGENGEPKACYENVRLMLSHAPEWMGVLGYNEFAAAPLIMKPPPALISFKVGDELQDNFDTELTQWLERKKLMVRPEQVRQVVDAVARCNAYHPVRDYLTGLNWDGKPRINKWLNNYMGVPISPYSMAVAAKFLISAVARIMQPGCKADHMLVLEGEQGIGKSTAARILAGTWFTDQLAELGTKDFSMQLRGVWLAEMAELDILSRADQSRVKAVLAQQAERFRPPYGKRVVNALRQCVFIGTGNRAEWMRDATGGRRYWPVKCQPLVGRLVDLEGLSRDRDQLWAEALHRYQAGELWWLTDDDVVVEAMKEQASRYEAHPWQGRIAAWAEAWVLSLVPDILDPDIKVPRGSVSVEEVLTHCLLKPVDRWEQRDKNIVADCLKSLKWERRYTGPRRKREWRYFPPPPPAEADGDPPPD
jgi:hypothetical protein